MRKMNRLVLVLALVSLISAGVLGAAQAQDTTAGSIQCDSDLILNLYIAERFFGYSQTRDQLTAGGADTSTWVDLNSINKGQYTPWFDSAMASSMGGTGTGTTGIGLNEQQVGVVSGSLMMDDASRQTMMNDSMTASGVDTTTLTQLAPSAVAGEAAECSQLRTELNRFFNVVAFNDYSGAFAGMSDMGTTDTSGTTTDTSGTTDSSGMEMTPEATPSS
jgi:hypothetical protein